MPLPTLALSTLVQGGGSKASVRDGHMATGCCGLDGKTEFSLLLSHRADESV